LPPRSRAAEGRRRVAVGLSRVLERATITSEDIRRAGARRPDREQEACSQRKDRSQMSRTSIIATLALVLGAAASAQSPAQASFAALTGLAGEWRGTDSAGHRVVVTFR